eukprot:COSAG02_NODE_8339_length_2608_cov_2.116381_3_plen_146_part_00
MDPLYVGLARIYRQAAAPGARASTTARLGLLAAAGLVALSFVLAIGFLAVSSNNYAGGDAMHLLHTKLAGRQADVQARAPRIHIGVEAAMSGVTRYVRLHHIFPLSVLHLDYRFACGQHSSHQPMLLCRPSCRQAFGSTAKKNYC